MGNNLPHCQYYFYIGDITGICRASWDLVFRLLETFGRRCSAPGVQGLQSGWHCSTLGSRFALKVIRFASAKGNKMQQRYGVSSKKVLFSATEGSYCKQCPKARSHKISNHSHQVSGT